MTVNIVSEPTPEYGSRAYALQSLRTAISYLERAKAGGTYKSLDAEKLDPFFAMGAAKSSIQCALDMLSRKGNR